MADSARLDRVESQVQRLTRSLQDLMFAVKRNGDEIATINRRADTEEWSKRFASLHESEADRLGADVKTIRRNIEGLRRELSES